MKKASTKKSGAKRTGSRAAVKAMGQMAREVEDRLAKVDAFEPDEVDSLQLAVLGEFQELQKELWSRYQTEILSFFAGSMPTYSPRLVRAHKDELAGFSDVKMGMDRVVMLRKGAQRRRHLRDLQILYWLHYRFVFGVPDRTPASCLLFLFYFPRFFAAREKWEDMGGFLLDEQTVIEALENEDEAKRIVSSHEDVFDISFLLYEFETGARDGIGETWPVVRAACEAFDMHELDKMADLDRFGRFLARLNVARRTLKNQLKFIARSFAKFETAEIWDKYFPRLSEMPLFEMGDFLLNEYYRLKDGYIAFVSDFRPSFDADATLELLKRVTPPLAKEDMDTCLREVELLRSGEMGIEESGLLNVILPAMQGKRPFVLREDRNSVKGQFSIPFVLDLEDGKYSIREKDAQLDASEGNSEGDSDKDAAEPEPEPGPDLGDNGESYSLDSVDGEESESEDADSEPDASDVSESENADVNEDADSAEDKDEDSDEADPAGASDGGPLDAENPEDSEEQDQDADQEESGDCGEDEHSDVNPDDTAPGTVLDGSDEEVPADQDVDANQADEQDGTEDEAEDEDDEYVDEAEDLFSKLYELGQQLLQNGHTAAYYWFARLMDEDEDICPTWLAELLHLGLHLRPMFADASHRVRELLQTAVNEYSELSNEQTMLLVASLVKPMLFQPQAGCISMLSDLAGRLKPLEPFLKHLREFVLRSQAIDEHVLTGRNAEDMRAVELSRLKEETRELLFRMENIRIPYKPATKIIHELFSPRGELGVCLRACLEDDFAPLRKLLAEDWGEDAQKDLMQAVNERVNNKRNPIQAGARTTTLNYIRQGLEKCEDWKRFAEARSEDDSIELIQPLLGSIPMRNAAVNGDESAHAALLQKVLQDLGPDGARGAGTLCAEKLDPAVELELWPLALPSGTHDTMDIADLYREFSGMTAEQLKGPNADSVAWHAFMGDLPLVEKYMRCHKDEDLSLSPDLLKAILTAKDQPFASLVPDGATLSDVHRAALTMLAAGGEYTSMLDPDGAALPEVYRAALKHWNTYLEEQEEHGLELISDAAFRGSILFSQQASMRESWLKTIGTAREERRPLDASEGLTEIIDRLAELDEALEKQLLERIDALKEQAEGKNFVHMQAKLEDIATRLVQEEKLFNYALVALEDIYAHLDANRDMDESDKKEQDVLSFSRDFYHRLENEPDAFVCKDKDSRQAWFDVDRFLRRNEPMHPRETAALTRLVRQLGFSLEGDEQPEEKGREGSPCFWRIVQVRASIDSPLPQWGSRSGDTHTFLLGWSVTPERLHQKISNSLSSTGPLNGQKAVTILCFNKLSYEDRTRILNIFRSLNFSALIVDEHLYNWLSHENDKVHALFGATLAGCACNPYTPDVAGAVPKEMFFGRRSMMSEVSRMDGSCIVYGGRQLGKTALLQQVASQEGEDRLVVQFSQPSMTTLLDTLFNELQKKEGFKGINHKNFVQSVENYLAENPGRSILVLADECDKALEEDEKEDFRQVRILSDVMQKTGRRFKIVLTGLHSVQRFSQVANVPFIHFGTPLCVGPLSPPEAYDLLVRPLQWLGIEFEDRQLAYLATSHCNYHSRVLQMLGEELVRAVNAPGNGRHGPLFTVTRQLLYDVLDSRELQEKIVECFNITLILDDRYLVIGYVMAILMLPASQPAGRGIHGIRINELYDELCVYWPAAFCNKQGDLTMLESLLHEMVGLGILVNVDKTYLLRTPNIINLLGGEETIESKLSQYEKKPYEPQLNLEGWRVLDSEAFVAAQYSVLAEKKNGIVVVVGSRALGLDDAPAALRSIALEQVLGRCVELNGPDAKTLMSRLQQTRSKHANDNLVFWASSSECAFVPDFLLQASSWLKTLRTGKRFVRVVCLLDPSSYFEFATDPRFDSLKDDPEIVRIELRRWTAQSVETWCKLYGKTAPDDLSALMEETGGWHALLFPRLEGKKAPGLEEYFAEPGVAFPERAEVKNLLHSLHLYGDLSLQDLVDDQPDEDPETVRQTLLLLRELHVVEHADESGEKFRLAPGISAGFGESRS